MIKDKINRGDDVREERQESRKARKRRNGVREDNFRNVRHGYKDKPSTVFQSRE